MVMALNSALSVLMTINNDSFDGQKIESDQSSQIFANYYLYGGNLKVQESI